MFKYMLLDEEIFAEFLDKIRSIQLLHRYASTKHVRMLCRKFCVFWTVWLNHLVLRTFFCYAQKARECQRIVEKTPYNTPHIAKLRAAFPNCKVLYIYRHPVDVLSSYRKVYRKDAEASWGNIPVADFCSRYARRVEAITRARTRRPEDTMMIRYESFVRGPMDEFRKICEFVDEPFEAEPVLIEDNPDRGSSDEEPITGEIQKRTKDWHDYLTVEDARIVEDTLGETMRELEYERYTSP
jgi:hypothetical protein